MIEDDSTGDVETSGVFDPLSDGIDFYETLEGMMASVAAPVAVGARNRFGETAVVSEGWTAGLLSPRGAIVVRADDFNPERAIVDDENFRPLASTPPNDTGDRFAAPLVGVMDYSFGNFKLQLTERPTVVSAGLSPETTTAPAGQELAVATFNVLNLAPITQDAAQMAADRGAPALARRDRAPGDAGRQRRGRRRDDRRRADVRGAYRRDPSGRRPDVRAPADRPTQQPGWRRAGRQHPLRLPLPHLAGAVVHRPAGWGRDDRHRGDRPSLGAAAVPEPGSGRPRQPGLGRAGGTRKPLVGEFGFRGKKLFVIANHLKSKTQDQPLFGRFQPPDQVTVPQRVAQAQIVNDFVDRILALDPHAYVLVLGDFNDFHFSDALQRVMGGVLTNLTETLPESERYTFVFDGNAQTLDHIVVSPGIAARSPVYDIVHVNAEFAVQASDHEAAVARINIIGRP